MEKIDWKLAADTLNQELARKGWKRVVTVEDTDWGLRLNGDAYGMTLQAPDGGVRYFLGPFVALGVRTPDGEFKTVVRYG